MHSETPGAQFVDALFQHVRNLTTAVTIIAAGLLASDGDWERYAHVPTLTGARTLGIFVAGFGVLLVLVNLWHGIVQVPVASPRLRIPVRVGLAAINLLITFRMVQLLVLLHVR